MRNSGRVIIGIMITLTLLSAIETTTAQNSDELAFLMKAGDKKSFTITQFRNGGDNSSEGMQYSTTLFPEISNVKLEKGTKITIEITQSYNQSDQYQTGVLISYRVIIGDFVSDELELNIYVNYMSVWFISTVDNRSYWEESVKLSQEIQDEFDSGYSVTLEGSLIVNRAKFDEYEGQNTEYCMKWSWKTGWLEYLYMSNYDNENDQMDEIEIQAETYEAVRIENMFAGFTGFLGELSTGVLFILVSFILGGSIAILIKKFSAEK